MKNSKLLILGLTALLAASCAKEAAPFDNPFVYINDINGGSSATIEKESNNLITELTVNLSSKKFDKDVTVSYTVTVGNGLTEGVDFKIQPSTKSPLTFSPGTYSMPVRIIWYASPSLDATKDNTVKFALEGCSDGRVGLGLPGKDKLHSKYIFTKQ